MSHFQFPKPGDLINLNDRKGSAHRSDQAEVWRMAARIAACEAVERGRLPARIERAFVSASLPVGSLNQRRRPSYFTPTVEAIVAGLRDADVIAIGVAQTPTFQQGGFVVVRVVAADG